MLSQQLAGGQVSWGELPVYLLAELAAGVAAGVAYVVISRTAADRTPRAPVAAPATTSVTTA